MSSAGKLVLNNGIEYSLTGNQLEQCLRIVKGKLRRIPLSKSEKGEIKRRAAAGETMRHIADALNRPYATIYAYARPYVKRISIKHPPDMQKQVVYEHIILGIPAKKTAKKYGLHMNTVYQWTRIYEDEVLAQWSR